MDSITQEKLARYHYHRTFPNQCTSIHVHYINSPLLTVWSLVRQFPTPQVYKPFVTSCTILAGDGLRSGSVRKVRITSGMPAGSSIERLDVLDEMQHVMGFSIVGGDHRLKNYRSTVTVHEAASRSGGAVVVESYVTDVPAGNTVEETCIFADTIVSCNLRSLADLAEKIGSSNSTFEV